MKVISVIDDQEIVKKILKHLGLWDPKERPPPKVTEPPIIPEHTIDYSMSQIPCFPDLFSDEGNPGSDKWVYVDPVYSEIYPFWFFKL